MSIATSSINSQLDDLRGRLAGRVIEPGDPDYEAARVVMYGGLDKRPRAIVRVANDADVQAVVNLARESGIELAIRSGGHGHAALVPRS